ncbi:hypothetical protein HNQ72_001281 [Rhizobium wenxiniae]|uniref:Propionyl-coenzyme A carboxylase alpha polypeptide n=1 Tax=Rhizobium wenxiniae TaxID=1737357 RepID=A0A7X0CYP2_9HYPH|nr:hypothetical protein [Rhizobium wenxiniae]
MNLSPSALPGISPTRGEISWTRDLRSPTTTRTAVSTVKTVETLPPVISPLVGEMPGRAEGGDVCPRQ